VPDNVDALAVSILEDSVYEGPETGLGEEFIDDNKLLVEGTCRFGSHLHPKPGATMCREYEYSKK
jgi:hypothetical protein